MKRKDHPLFLEYIDLVSELLVAHEQQIQIEKELERHRSASDFLEERMLEEYEEQTIKTKVLIKDLSLNRLLYFCQTGRFYGDD